MGMECKGHQGALLLRSGRLYFGIVLLTIALLFYSNKEIRNRFGWRINQEGNQGVDTRGRWYSQTDHTHYHGNEKDLSLTFQPIPSNNSGKLQENSGIIVLSYLRSGSTFTADMLHQSEDVFYMYEPLKPFNEGYFLPTLFCSNVKHSCTNPDGWRSDSQVVRRTLTRILSCDITQLPPAVIRSARSKYKTSKDYFALRDCAKTHNLTDCVVAMETQCKDKVRLIKTIRVTMELLSRLLPNFPNLKIVHLLRDPRGIMTSRLKGKFVNDSVLRNRANITCQRMYNDLIWTLQLQQYYPGRIKIMLYDAIAEQPIKATENLYHFAGLELTDDIRRYVFEHTAAGKRSNGYYRTIRGNSTKTAHAWRNNISWENVNAVDESCSLLYDFIGLIPFSHPDELKNFSFKTRNVVNHMFGEFL